MDYHEALKELERLDAKEVERSIEFRKRILPKLKEIQEILDDFKYGDRYNKFNTRSFDLMEMLGSICCKLEARFEAEITFKQQS